MYNNTTLGAHFTCQAPREALQVVRLIHIPL
uniref:Uncharacterized protein n=1 Tax=Arundo donax TaxID=35708 RepID=A0A0A9F6L1_ARUDO